MNVNKKTNLEKYQFSKFVQLYAFIDNEYESVTRLYHLDQMETREGTDTEGTRKDLGPLPAGAKALLMALAAAWAGIAAFGLKEGIRKKKSNQEK